RCLRDGVGADRREDHPARRVGEALRTRLLEAIAQLRPAAKTSELAGTAAAWRRHRLLELRYVEALAPERVQEQLGIEKSQYYREHARALEAVVSLLAQQWPAAARANEALTSAGGAG